MLWLMVLTLVVPTLVELCCAPAVGARGAHARAAHAAHAARAARAGARWRPLETACDRS